MKAILPSLAGLLLWAAFARGAFAQVASPPALQRPAAAAVDSISPQALLQRTLAAVDSQPAISAKVLFKINLAGQALRGTGQYLQQGRGGGRQVRLTLEINSDGRIHRLQQIGDGKQLWVVDEQPGAQTISRIDLDRVRAARPAAGRTASPRTWLMLGGLPKLLASMESDFQFDYVAQGRLGEVPVWILEGRWKAARLADLLPEQRGAIEAGKPFDTSPLAPNVPDWVVLNLGADDFLPYRLEFWRSEPATAGASSAGRRSLLVMDIYEVDTQSPIDSREFAFDGGKAPVIDLTPKFLESQGLEEASPVGAGQSRPRR